MSSSYVVPAKNGEMELVIKKSRFIARASHVQTKEEAKAVVAQARRDFPDARHYCWAYLLGNPAIASSASMNDDGEPSGTAGKPILNVIQHKNVGDVIVVVIRYFGGVKLGAGGLTRAYSASAEAVMSRLEVTEVRPMTILALTLDFSKEQFLRHWLDSNGAEVVKVSYGSGVNIEVNLPESVGDEFRLFCSANAISIG